VLIDDRLNPYLKRLRLGNLITVRYHTRMQPFGDEPVRLLEQLSDQQNHRRRAIARYFVLRARGPSDHNLSRLRWPRRHGEDERQWGFGFAIPVSMAPSRDQGRTISLRRTLPSLVSLI
jgi:hypothetical protein